LTPSAGLEPVSLIPSVSRPLIWPLVEASPLSHGEPRKSQSRPRFQCGPRMRLSSTTRLPGARSFPSPQ
jgi:hypothetical protein